MESLEDGLEERRRYVRIRDALAQRIAGGEWRAHDKLPSVRQLAAQYEVNRLTAYKACRLLQTDGWIYAKEKSGYYVSGDEPAPESAAAPPDAPEGLRVSGRLRNEMFDIQGIPVAYQFSQALIDPNLLPNLYMSEYVKRVFDLYPKLIGTYATAQGDEELREALAGRMSADMRDDLRRDDLLITTGAQQAIDLISRTFLRSRDAILIERPTYSAAIAIFRHQGVRMLPVDIRPDGYDLAQVEALMRVHRPRLFYMNPTFHNPTGYTVPTAQRKRLVELAERYRCLLVEDDAFREMYFEEPPPPPLFAYDTEGWVVYLRSYSKYVAPGLRICAVAGHRTAIAPLVTAKSLADNGTPLVNQKIFLHYLLSERMRQHVEKLRTALQIRRDIMEEELCATGWQWTTPRGGLNLWLRTNEDLEVEALLRESLRQSLSFVPGAICDPFGGSASHIRLSYAFANESLVREGVRRLAAIARTI
ncbi:aminotransferase-like domain-containing protein [Cohnella nanjingensis]|uniref:PLP-dependent aminotransferase family protein n=1 Tax=Cohnella nanjingensis TaxID=1387779 RepID=A0A7X0RSC9_9BACL|nr:PLP-dependent aminotransferase family protein [Cohnella nanjingensis]MBB6671359.1 PLP-dependent aminotransferase family protein [Cohnella nanjingensis]